MKKVFMFSVIFAIAGMVACNTASETDTSATPAVDSTVTTTAAPVVVEPVDTAAAQ